MLLIVLDSVGLTLVTTTERNGVTLSGFFDYRALELSSLLLSLFLLVEIVGVLACLFGIILIVLVTVVLPITLCEDYF